MYTLQLGDFSSDLLSLATPALAKSVTRMTVETAVTPTIVVDDPFAPGPPSPLLQLLKPKVTLTTAAGPLVIAPYGTPSPRGWLWALAGAALLGAATTAAVFWAGRKSTTFSIKR